MQAEGELLRLGLPGHGGGNDVVGLLPRCGDGRRCLLLGHGDEPGRLALRFGHRLVGRTLGGEERPLQHPFRALELENLGLELLRAGTGCLHILDCQIEGDRHLVEEDVDLLVAVATERVVEALPQDVLGCQAHQSPIPHTKPWTSHTMMNQTMNERSMGMPYGWGTTLRRALTGGSVTAWTKSTIGRIPAGGIQPGLNMGMKDRITRARRM